jgi:hypothetical protein
MERAPRAQQLPIPAADHDTRSTSLISAARGTESNIDKRIFSPDLKSTQAIDQSIKPARRMWNIRTTLPQLST